ncbi:transcriptional regulator [Neisseria weixii]|uniref:Transcriptional regulator n=2 Tax=Neisseria weixii TaxID=1853276 RepID=A0A3N4NBG0_9NEIS|nr:transcriptional regulator [Neisseria weixii]RPD89430.1 transcriptional regulator [Neisseria weixii]
MAETRGLRAEYAKKLGVSPSFLSQIQSGLSVTPKRLYKKVIELTGGSVSLSDLTSESVRKDDKAV